MICLLGLLWGRPFSLATLDMDKISSRHNRNCRKDVGMNRSERVVKGLAVNHEDSQES
jgi:hypothetical protein